MSALGLNGIMHLDVISFVPPYPCKDPMHPLNRKQTVEYQNKVGEYARKIFGGLASEGGYDHVARTLDFALYLWTYPLWDDNPEMLPEKYVSAMAACVSADNKEHRILCTCNSTRAL